MISTPETKDLCIQLAQSSDEHKQAGILQQLLKNYRSLDIDDHQVYAERLLALAEQQSDDLLLRANALYHMAVFKRAKGEHLNSADFSRRAISLYQQIGDIGGLMHTNICLGNVYYHRVQYAEALESYTQALEYALEADDMWGVATSYNNIGNVYEKMGNYPEALKNQFASLKISRQTGDKRGTANSHNNIGLLYFYYGSYDEALQNYRASMEIMEEIGDKSALAITHNNLGLIYQVRGQYDEALQQHLASLRLNTEIDDQWGIATSYNNMGYIYEKQGNIEEALKNQCASIKLCEELGDKYIPASAHSNIGAIYEKQGDYTKALEHLLMAMKLSEEIGYKEVIKESSLSLSKVYRALGDHEQAMNHFERFHELEKELTGQESQKQLAVLNFQHDMELKEKEAALLRQKNEEIGVYVNKLEISNNDLKQFAHIASHDLREPLRMVSSYINLIGQTMNDRATSVEKEFIGFALDGAARMEHLIHDLLRLAKVDATPHIERVSLLDIVEELKSSLEVLLREKHAAIVTEALPDIMADRTQIMQLFQNLVGNGVKYNESDAPLIMISCQHRDTDILLSIADNGIGIPVEYREKAFQLFQRLPGAKAYQGTGIGLAICKKIVDGLQGTISIDHNPGGGTIFHISLPHPSTEMV